MGSATRVNRRNVPLGERSQMVDAHWASLRGDHAGQATADTESGWVVAGGWWTNRRRVSLGATSMFWR